MKVWIGVIIWVLGLSGCSAVNETMGEMGWVRIDQVQDGTRVVHGVVSAGRGLPEDIPPARNRRLPSAPIDGAGYGWLSWEDDFGFEPYYRSLARAYETFEPDQIPFPEALIETVAGENLFSFATRVRDRHIDPLHLAASLFLSNNAIPESILGRRVLEAGQVLKMPSVREINQARGVFEQVVLQSRLSSQLENGSIKFINASYKTSLVDSTWISSKAGGYLVQLASSLEPDDLIRFAQSLDQDRPLVIFVFNKTKNGRLYYGLASTAIYPTAEAALSAINQLPKQVRAHQPWIRSIAKLKRQIAEHQIANNQLSLPGRLDGPVKGDVNGASIASTHTRRADIADEDIDPSVLVDSVSQVDRLTALVGRAYVHKPVSREVVHRSSGNLRAPGALTRAASMISPEDDWQSTTSTEQNAQRVDRAGEYYLGVVTNPSKFTETLETVAGDHDPLLRVLEWNFRAQTRVGSAIQEIAEFIGYKVVVRDEIVHEVYSRTIPVPHRLIVGVAAEQAIIMLGGQGLLAVFDHTSRTVSHMPRKAYVVATQMSEGEVLPSCPADLSKASVLNGIGGNIFLLEDGSTCAY